MLARWLRTWETTILRPVIVVIASCGVRPNTLTLLSLAIAVASGFTLSQGSLVAGAFLLLAGGLLDALDGELARFLRCDSQLGGFIDSISDHCGDFSIYMGILWFSLGRNMAVLTILIFVSSFGSLLGSHIRSRAAMAGVDTRDIGLFTRCERILVLALGLFAGKVTVALWLLAIFNNFSAAQRLVYVMNARRP